MTISTADVRRGLEEIDYLENAWPQLITLGTDASNRRRLPATRRRSGEALERAQREAAIEAAERKMLGWVPALTHAAAPADVSMLDLIAELVAVADDLSETITGVAGVPHPSAVSAWVDPRPRLRIARAWLTKAQDEDPRTLAWARGILGPVVRATAQALGEIVDGQVLDALCPWCKGRTERRPMGGERTLVVHAGPTAVTTQEAPEERGVGWPRIVCHGVNCTPPASACGTQWKGRPTWPEREWDWLAKQLQPVEQGERIRA